MVISLNLSEYTEHILYPYPGPARVYICTCARVNDLYLYACRAHAHEQKTWQSGRGPGTVNEATDSWTIRYGMLIALTSIDISGAYIDLEIWRFKKNKTKQ